MELRKITEKPKKKIGLVLFLIILLILGFIAVAKLGLLDFLQQNGRLSVEFLVRDTIHELRATKMPRGLCQTHINADNVDSISTNNELRTTNYEMSTDFEGKKEKKKGWKGERVVVGILCHHVALLAPLESAKLSIWSVWLVNNFYIGKEPVAVALSVISPYA